VKRILVAIDETEASARAARFVNEFFAGFEAEIIGLSVARSPVPEVPPDVPYGGMYLWTGPRTYDVGYAQRAAEVAAQESDRVVLESGLEDATTVAEFGDPEDRILDVAEDRDVDLIVVGSSHKGFLKRALEGSLSEALVRRSARPVLVVE
jgi:nucleotide-binding universal stress UspA family protein